MHRPHHHLDRSRLKYGWAASEPVRSLRLNLSYLFAVIFVVEGEMGESREMEEEEMIRIGWEGDERPMREDERVIREGQRVMEQ